MAELNFDEIAVFLPRYLNPAEQRGLFEEIKRFPHNFAFYDLSESSKDSVLQGDGWRGFLAIDFWTLQKKTVSGVIISNSCDIAVDNRHDHAPNVLFAPLIKLANFADLLRKPGKSEDSIQAKLEAVRRQGITSFFYFPKCGDFLEESIIVLDDVHRHPLNHFVKADKTKLFTLTQFAFYLFLIKLSIHFHRVNEGVHRFIPNENVAT